MPLSYFDVASKFSTFYISICFWPTSQTVKPKFGVLDLARGTNEGVLGL